MAKTKAAIAADSPLTAAAGARIAHEGGNAVDIAVAAALAATVAEALMCSIGGAGFFMVRSANQKAELFDGVDVLPSLSGQVDVNNLSRRTAHIPYGEGIDVTAGHASIAVPGLLAAAEMAWKSHGCLPWKEIVAPAFELASSEIHAGVTLEAWLKLGGKALFYQQAASRECFFPDGENHLKADDLFRIPNLDHTLALIGEEGTKAFYEGDLGAEFVKEMEENGGLVRRNDLAHYRAERREPLLLRSRGFDLALNPPPAVGGTAVGCLINLVQSNWYENMSTSDRANLHARSQLRLLGIRENRFVNPDLDDSTARELLKSSELPFNRSALQSPNTTHLSVVTDDGSMVSVTMSAGYGSGVIVPSLGIACNNSLGEPELNPYGFLGAKPSSRLISNMAPTLAWHNDGRCISFGSPGASRITTSIAQTWTRFALEGMSFDEAVHAPRLHIESFPNGPQAQFEPGVDTSKLDGMFNLRPFESLNTYFGGIKLAALNSKGEFEAVADKRRRGAIEIVE